ncbi:MAG TPA: sugar transferase [Polyangiales bacterium]|nr:sugar transferase [Polyangiales bacterium]
MSTAPNTSERGQLQLVLDAGMVVGSIFLASSLHQLLRPLWPPLRVPPNFEAHATLVYLVLPLWLVLSVMFRLHVAVAQRVGQAELLVRLTKLHVAGLAALSIVQFVTHSVINRSLVALFLLSTFALMYLQRTAAIAWARFQYRRGTGRERLLLIGLPSRRMSEFVRAALASPDPPQLLGYLEAAPDDGEPPPDAPPLPCLGTLDELSQVLHAQAVDHVMFFPPANRPERLREALAACEEVGVTASFSLELVQLAAAVPRVTEHYDHAFASFETSPKRADALAIKYGLDPLIAGLLLIATAPLTLAIACAIWASTGRPIFYAQDRTGWNGRPFRMYKFRSMRVGAEEERDALTDVNQMSGPVFKLRDDPRVTGLGRALRKTSLDELPQLWNVLTGSMSLVGPRPLPLSEQAQIRGWQRRRLTMKPGLTCLWQVSGRSDVDFVDWMLLDLKYVNEWSLWLDLLILLKTVPVVLFGRGAS